jgi:cobalt-zinc-cadmium efflux system outer membrane protein
MTLLMMPGKAFPQVPVKITLDDAILLALHHNYTLQAARTTIQQSQAQEITANPRPDPVLVSDWEYLPFFAPSYWASAYLRDSTEADLGLSYLIERGKKRQHRLQAGKDQTAVANVVAGSRQRRVAS